MYLCRAVGIGVRGGGRQMPPPPSVHLWMYTQWQNLLIQKALDCPPPLPMAMYVLVFYKYILSQPLRLPWISIACTGLYIKYDSNVFFWIFETVVVLTKKEFSRKKDDKVTQKWQLINWWPIKFNHFAWKIVPATLWHTKGDPYKTLRSSVNHLSHFVFCQSH